MDEKQKLGNTIVTLRQLLDEMQGLSQPRSNFALTHFVVGQHDLPGRQYQQALLELQAMLFAMGDMYDDLEVAQLDLADLHADELMPLARKEIAMRRANRKMEEMKINIAGRLREAEFLVALLNSMPKYTLEDLEKEEAEYWNRRLSRQHFMALTGDPGNVDAMIQMFTRPGEAKPLIEGSQEMLARLGGSSVQALPGGENDLSS